LGDTIPAKRQCPGLEVRTRRRVFVVERGKLPAGQVTLDETTIGLPASGRSRARLRRVEIEVPEAEVPRLASFVDRLRRDCGLQPAGLSK